MFTCTYNYAKEGGVDEQPDFRMQISEDDLEPGDSHVMVLHPIADTRGQNFTPADVKMRLPPMVGARVQ
eukprot:13221649-Heterocapsa_arctica.AAC.1